jgi:glycosyltransferase involved in cell wall biosynthesis
MPRVSVIMPAFNRERQLARAVESVLRQDFGDFELIIVDDASTDGTTEIAELYRDMDQRVVLVSRVINSRTPGSETEPRNDGIRVANGELFAYLDSDNEWHHAFLSVLIRAVDANPDVLLVHCDSLNFYRPGELMKILKTDKRTLVFAGLDCAIFSHDAIVAEEFGRNIYVDTNEMLHRRLVFERLGSFWRVCHPELSRIQMYQGNKFPHRRHNDLDLFERVYATCGEDSIRHVRQVLTRFIYPGAETVGLYDDEAMDTINETVYKKMKDLSKRELPR